MDRASARILDAPVPSQLQQDAYAMLEPEVGDAMGDQGQPPLLERMLLRGMCRESEGTALDVSEARPQKTAPIHFLRFWQAWSELERRLGQLQGCQGREEPLAEEVGIFRDALLRHATTEGLSAASLCSEATAAREMSADQAAWEPLQEAARALAAGGVDLLRSSGGSASRWPARDEDLCKALLEWLGELAEDYRVGKRGALIKAVRDVTRCTVREACFALGARGWDVEAALICRFGKGSLSYGGEKGQPVSWCTQGAKLRKSEVECPICAEPYESGCKPVVIKCCYQVLCKSCHERLTKPAGARPDAEFHCPFCRKTDKLSAGWDHQQRSSPAAARSSSFSGVGSLLGRGRRRATDTAGAIIPGVFGFASQMLTDARGEASRAYEELSAAWREEDQERRMDAGPASERRRATAPRTAAGGSSAPRL